jgi:hypothetical protein
MKTSEHITPTKIRQRKIAEGVIAGRSHKEIAESVGMSGKYVSNAVGNRVRDKGTQAEIAQIIDESNVLSFVTVERIIHNIQKLAFDEALKPKEREGYLRMLAEYKALLKQVNLNETVVSADALVESAEQALDKLKQSIAHDDAHTHDARTSIEQDRQHIGQGMGEDEKVDTGSGKEVEATPSSVSENKTDRESLPPVGEK